MIEVDAKALMKDFKISPELPPAEEAILFRRNGKKASTPDFSLET